MLLDQKRTSSKSPDTMPQSLFGPSATNLEGHIIGAIFKKFVTKLVSASKEIKSHENMVKWT